jgi:transposase
MRSRRTRIPAEEKVRIVLSVLAGEMTGAEAARRHGVSVMSVSKWKARFLEAGVQGLQERPGGPAGQAGTPEERRMRMENEQLKLALAEATVQLRIWQKGAQYVDEVPSVTSRP